MRKLCLLLISGILALAASTAEARVIKVGSECTYPPFNYRDAAGNLAGFDIDIAKEVGKRMGVDLEFVCQAWDGMIPALLAGKFDLIVASMSITEERLKSIDFSIPYRSSTGRFVGRKGLDIHPFTADGKPDPAALKGKIVGIARATTYDTYLTEQFPGVEIVRYDTADNNIMDLRSGRIDLMMAGPIKLATAFLDKPEGKDFTFIGPEIEDEKYFGPGVGIGLRKNQPELVAEVNKALKSMFDDGTFKTINLKYWSFSVMPSVWK